MNNLDNLSIIHQLDPQKVAESLMAFPEQLLSGWQTAKIIKLPQTYQDFSEIISCGMGGSNLATELLRDIYQKEITRPLILIRNYSLPKFVSKKSLIIINSYSGNTEETLACFQQALKISTKIIVITSGGKLLKLAYNYNVPTIKLETKFNPSQQPRYGIGLQLGVLLRLLKQLNQIKITEQEILIAKQKIQLLNKQLSPINKTRDNLSKQIAKKLLEKIIFLIAGEHLKSNAHILANQINESAKQVAIPIYLPELNHHLLEAFSYPKSAIKNYLLLFFTSRLYGSKIKKRLLITNKIFKHLSIETLFLNSLADNYLTSALEILIYSNWISFYLAIINNKNPADIPLVNLFKKELKK